MKIYKVVLVFENGGILSLKYISQAARNKSFKELTNAKLTDSSVLVYGGELYREIVIDTGALQFFYKREEEREQEETNEEMDEEVTSDIVDFFKGME